MKIRGEDITINMRDPNAQDLLWAYAERLRLGRDKTMDKDAEEIETMLISLGFEPEGDAEDLRWTVEEPSGSLFDDPEEDDEE